MGPALRTRLIALVVLALAGACAGGSTPGAAAPGGEPALQRVLDRIGDDGTIDRDTALQAFAVAFTPPPGVSRPPGPSRQIASGSGPLRWVSGHQPRNADFSGLSATATVPTSAARSSTS